VLLSVASKRLREIVGQGNGIRVVCRLEGLQIGMLRTAEVPRTGWGIGIGREKELRGRGERIVATSGKRIAWQYGKVKCFAGNGRK
jgi:hypothetical protein